MLDHKTHPQKIQLDTPPDPGTAKANLGTATFLMSHLIPQQQPQQTAENATPANPPTNQETGTDLKAEMSGLEDRIFQELGTLKQEIQKAQPQDANKELQDLKNQLQSIIDAKE